MGNKDAKEQSNSVAANAEIKHMHNHKPKLTILSVDPDELWSKQSGNGKTLDILTNAMQSCVMMGKHEMLEWYCLQEIYETEYWSREDFRSALRQSYFIGASAGKLTAMRILASYCIPHIVSMEQIFQDLNNRSFIKAQSDHYCGHIEWGSAHFDDYQVDGFSSPNESKQTLEAVMDVAKERYDDRTM